MSFFENFQDVFFTVGKKAKETYNIKVLMLKIKGYEKEINHYYTDIGKHIYVTRKEGSEADEQTLSYYIENIDNLNYRVNQLSNQIEIIKAQEDNPPLSKTVQDDKENKYLKFAMKDDDLKIKRTAEGIQAVRICPVCSKANRPSHDICSECNSLLRKNRQ